MSVDYLEMHVPFISKVLVSFPVGNTRESVKAWSLWWIAAIAANWVIRWV